VSREDLEALMERVRCKQLLDSDVELIQNLIETLTCINDSMDENARTIKKLLGMIFGSKTEKKDHLFPHAPHEEEGEGESNESTPEDKKEENPAPGKTSPQKKASGHGHLGADDYKGANVICVGHESLKAGDSCPQCKRGKVYPKKEFGTLIRFTGHAPLAASIYQLEKMR